MEERLNRIEDRLDKVLETQASIQANLQEHMRRTEIAESNIEKLAEAMAPVQEHVAFIRVSGRILTWVAGVGATVAAFLALR